MQDDEDEDDDEDASMRFVSLRRRRRRRILTETTSHALMVNSAELSFVDGSGISLENDMEGNIIACVIQYRWVRV